jgi:hypothetical protein
LQLECDIDSDYDPWSIYTAAENQRAAATAHSVELFSGDVDDIGLTVSRHVGIPLLSTTQVAELERPPPSSKTRLDLQKPADVRKYLSLIGQSHVARPPSPIKEVHEECDEEAEEEVQDETENETEPLIATVEVQPSKSTASVTKIRPQKKVQAQSVQSDETLVSFKMTTV